MEKKLEQLLIEKHFHQLTAEEKYYVTEMIGEAEYNRMHLLIKKSKNVLSNRPAFNPEIKNRLMAAFRQHHGTAPVEKPTAVIRFLRYRIPAWQAVAAVAVLFGLHFWLQDKSIIIEKPEVVYVHSVDTVYKEVAMPLPIEEKPATDPIPRVNVKPRPVTAVFEPKEPVYIASTDSASLQHAATQLPDSFNLMVSQPRGKSATQVSELWHLLEVVY